MTKPGVGKAASDSSMRGFFAPGGWLARTHPRYEFRSGQLEMAQLVEAAFREKRHLLVEAGTGTGKTLAYLVPALLSGRRVVVSTGTKNLQEQLFYQDIPFLEQHLGRPLHVCYMKGRNNYLCRQKLYDLNVNGAEVLVEDPEELALLREWEPRTETGDRAELASLPESSALWPHLNARRETCTGQKCPQFERCFLTLMHQRALESDLVIVNHHLFFADLALKRREVPGLGVIPDYHAVILDEAHELEEVASQYFGLSVSNYRLEELARDCEQVLRMKAAPEGAAPVGAGLKPAPTPAAFQAARRVRERTERLFALLEGEEGRVAFDQREQFRDEGQSNRYATAYAALAGALEALESALAALRDKPEEVHALIRRAAEIRADLAFLLAPFQLSPADARAPDDTPDRARTRSNRLAHQVGTALEGDDRHYVYWIERRGRGTFLQATPIDVAAILSEALFDQVETCVLTSATLAVGGSFEFVKRRLGIQYARERALDSHFDFPRQALLYIPPELPDPRRPEFAERAAREVSRILKATRGRAFVLFTSYQQMFQVYEMVSQQLPALCRGGARPAPTDAGLKYTLLVQGDAPRSALLDRFRKEPHPVLFATASFWQGVDVPGEQLSCVIIDRLPFAVPTDPVVAARLRLIQEDGGNPFLEYQVPQAVISLKQGFGRLIRSRTDRGVLAILDTRILTKNYGTIFLESLPDYRSTRQIGEVERFME